MYNKNDLNGTGHHEYCKDKLIFFDDGGGNAKTIWVNLTGGIENEIMLTKENTGVYMKKRVLEQLPDQGRDGQS